MTGQQVRLVKQVQQQVDDGEIEKFNVEDPKPSLLGSAPRHAAAVRRSSCCCSCS